mmetsp:Transcript_31072/g.48664  ORF Transcript_31072/g.48664 Transcript_31072/m.48664 type:complete len:228 (+) Transcript_31072:363-1046(+)
MVDLTLTKSACLVSNCSLELLSLPEYLLKRVPFLYLIKKRLTMISQYTRYTMASKNVGLSWYPTSALKKAPIPDPSGRPLDKSQRGRIMMGSFLALASFASISSNSCMPYMARPAAMKRMKTVVLMKNHCKFPMDLPMYSTATPKRQPNTIPTQPPVARPVGSVPLPTAPRKRKVSRPSRKTALKHKTMIVQWLTVSIPDEPEPEPESSSELVPAGFSGLASIPPNF